MLESDFPSQNGSAWWSRKALWIVAAGGVLAFVLWVLPNWSIFVQHMTQFPALWQIPGNHIIIVYLVIKILSPLLIMGIFALLLWIYGLVQAEAEATEEPEQKGPEQQDASPLLWAAVRTPPVAVSGLVPQVNGSLSRSAPFEQPVSRSATTMRVSDPVTPLPPMMSRIEELREQMTNGVPLEDFLKQSSPPLTSESTQNGQSESVEVLSRVPSSPPLLALPQTDVIARGPGVASDPLISIRLLKDVSLSLLVPGGGRVIVPLTLNAKRVQLLAYIAWRRGEMIDRDKILEHVFGWGVNDEDATEEKLSERFESHKKLLRKKIRDVAEQTNRSAGKQLINPDLVDPFQRDAGFWGLSDICRVEDLEELERCYKAIAMARKDGKLVDETPEFVRAACEQLIASYSGDFLETVIKKYPGEFRPFQGRSSWARRPFTQYRDYYLDALWRLAEYEWRLGQNAVSDEDARTNEANVRKQQEYFGRAAQRYQNYAMYACNSRFDAKATFGAYGEYGERVGMSERALRRCVVLLGAIGRTDLVNQVWSAYITQMKSISDQRWQPSKETQDDVAAAKAQTNAYRFAAQVSQMSSEFADRRHVS